MLTSHHTLKMLAQSSVFTDGENILHVPQQDDIDFLAPCSHEEADTRLMVGYMCLTLAADHGHHKIHIRTVDTDLVVLAVIVAQTLPDGDELWVANLPCTGLCSCDGDCI